MVVMVAALMLGMMFVKIEYAATIFKYGNSEQAIETPFLEILGVN